MAIVDKLRYAATKHRAKWPKSDRPFHIDENTTVEQLYDFRANKSRLWEDAGKSDECEDGDTCVSFEDIGPRGADMTRVNATAGARYDVDANGSGWPGLYFDGTDDRYNTLPGGAQTWADAGFSVVCVWTPSMTGQATLGGLLSYANGSQYPTVYDFNYNDPGYNYGTLCSVDGTPLRGATAASPDPVQDAMNIACWSFNPDSFRFPASTLNKGGNRGPSVPVGETGVGQQYWKWGHFWASAGWPFKGWLHYLAIYSDIFDEQLAFNVEIATANEFGI
jgi:hypothetical protein